MVAQVNCDMKAKAILFDLDGTLVNSLPAVERCWLKFSQRHKLNHSYVLDTIHGRKAIDNIRYFFPNKSEEFIKKEFLWLERLESDDLMGINEISGASDFLRQLSLLNIPWGIVTSGTRPVAMSRFNLLKVPIPQVFITGEMVMNTKPAPDGYLQGVKSFGLQTEQCIVFEDSVAGIESAFNANCQVIGVNIPNSINHEVELYIRTFNELCLVKNSDNELVVLKK